MRQSRPDRAPALALLASAIGAVGLGGCAPWLERPLAGLRERPSAAGPDLGFVRRFEPPIPCGAGPYPSRGMQGEDTVTIGAVRFHGLGYRYGADRFAAGAPPLTVPIEVPPHLRVVIEVPPDRLDHIGLDNAPIPAERPEAAHRAMRCVTGPATAVHTVTFVLDGPQCVPVSVTHRSTTRTRVVGFGVPRCPPPDPPDP